MVRRFFTEKQANDRSVGSGIVLGAGSRRLLIFRRTLRLIASQVKTTEVSVIGSLRVCAFCSMALAVDCPSSPSSSFGRVIRDYQRLAPTSVLNLSF